MLSCNSTDPKGKPLRACPAFAPRPRKHCMQECLRAVRFAAFLPYPCSMGFQPETERARRFHERNNERRTLEYHLSRAHPPRTRPRRRCRCVRGPGLSVHGVDDLRRGTSRKRGALRPRFRGACGKRRRERHHRRHRLRRAHAEPGDRRRPVARRALHVLRRRREPVQPRCGNRHRANGRQPRVA